MCCNKRRQRGTQDAAILHAAARAVNHELQHYNSSSTSVVPGVIGEQPPPYLYSEKQPIVDKKAETYEDVAQQWLSAGGPNKRRSFSSYHSFDAEAVPTYVQVPSPSPAMRHPVSNRVGEQFAAPSGLLGWLMQRQQRQWQRGGCCSSRRGCC